MTASTGMDPFVFAAVLAAAAMHAGWNAVLKVRLDPFLAMSLVTTAAGVVAIPLLFAFGWPKAAAWPWVIASIVLHLGYYIGLTEAYRRADMGQIYPIARGSAPLLTAVSSLLLLAEPIGLLSALGIATLAAGIVLMSLRVSRGLKRTNLVALGFALFTAVTITGYTLVDGIGARRAGDPHAYSAALFVLDGLAMGLFALWRRGLADLAPALRFVGPGIAGGAMSLAAYWIAIWAMTVAPIPLVAALRETSVLFAVLISTVILKEPLTANRMVAAGLIVTGVVLIRLQ